MDASASTRASTRGCIKIDNPQKKDHAKPPETAHGLCLANPCRVGLVGGVGASKTTTLLNIIARCAEWKPFEHIYLMGPSHCVEDMQKGEYNLLDVTPLEHFPTLDYFSQRPGRSAMIIDDRHLHDLSKKGAPSQKELADRICGHVSSHHLGPVSQPHRPSRRATHCQGCDAGEEHAGIVHGLLQREPVRFPVDYERAGRSTARPSQRLAWSQGFAVATGTSSFFCCPPLKDRCLHPGAHPSLTAPKLSD